MPKLYVLIGVPGSGKSTWVANQDWAKDCVYISTDKLVEEHANRRQSTYSDVFRDYMPTAVNLMIDEVIKAREENKDIIWDQTSTTVYSRLKKFKMLPEYYTIAVVFPTPERSELDRRLANRPGKIIPKEVVDKMIEDFQDPTEEEGFKEIWYAV